MRDIVFGWSRGKKIARGSDLVGGALRAFLLSSGTGGEYMKTLERSKVPIVCGGRDIEAPEEKASRKSRDSDLHFRSNET